ncbi:hypothetical protein Tco_0877596 [Tanacetum coccineum]|uniref:Uncharacterized protein n=1 Tax=Tanacetum coccineum TaxID=301880 RepID=A0ABQ5BVM6_9ASTR
MVNVIPPDYVDDVLVIEPNQHDDVPVVPEPVLENEDEDPEEEEFEKEEVPQEKEDDIEVDIEEYKNEPELTYPYKEVDPLNPLPTASESEPEDSIENERVERDLYWTRVQVYEFYQEMIHRGFVFEERPNEAINVPIEDEKSPSFDVDPNLNRSF